jgi:Fur family peroxide stress response transcriptional regulator
MEITMNNRLENILSRFKDLGYRITPQRMAILQALISDTGHPTVEQVYEKVKADFPMTSRATVYKTIGLLKDMGEVTELNFSSGGSHFDGIKQDNHPHLICTHCQQIIDLEEAPTGQTFIEVALDNGFMYQSHSLTIYGICPECQQLLNN